MSMVSQLGMSYEPTKGSGYAVSQACCMGWLYGPLQSAHSICRCHSVIHRVPCGFPYGMCAIWTDCKCSFGVT